MKIKELHLRNIASIEKADIDFENELKDIVTGEPASIFLIAGDTGTGKSVILDGISMALYKKTPRIVGVANKTNNEYIDNQGQAININSIEQYTRLGISEKDECYSELVFEGNDGKIYHAKLELGLTKGNTDEKGNRPIKHSTPKWTVKVGNEDWQKVEAKTGQPILDAIGLSFEQFGRMAMLAQGQFASFLTGDKSEREQILEQLTNTERFTTYGTAISNLFSTAKTNKANAQTTLETEKKHTLKPEQLEELNSQLTILQKEKVVLDDEHDKVQNTLNSVCEISTNLDEQKKAEKQKAAVVGIIESDDYKAKKTLVSDWDATNNERRLFSDKTAAEQKKVKAEKLLAKAKDNFAIYSADLVYREEVIEKYKQNTNEIQAEIDNQKALDEVFAKADAVVLQLGQYQDTCRKITAVESSLAAEKGKTESLASAVAEWESKAATAKDAVKAEQDSIDALNDERNALNPIEINTEFKVNTERKNNLKNLQQRVEKIAESQASLDSSKQEIETESTKLSEYKKAFDAAQDEYDSMLKKEEEAHSLLSTMKMSVEETLTELRQRLHADHADTCPLCGQHIDTLHLDNDFQQMLTPLQQREAEAKKNLTDATAKRDEAKSKFDTLNGVHNNKKLAYEEALKDFESEKTSIVAEAKKLSLDASQGLDQQITVAIQKTEKDLAVLEEKQRKTEALQTQINDLAEEKKSLDKTLSNAEKELLKAQNAVVSNGKDIRKYENDLAELKSTKDDLNKILSSCLNASYPTWQTDTNAIKAQFKADANAYCDKKKKVEHRKAETEKWENLLASVKDTRTNILANHNDWDQPVEPKEYKTDNLNSIWTSLLTTISHQDLEIETAIKVISDAETALNAYYASSGKTEESLKIIINAENLIAEARKFVGEKDSELKSRTDAIAAYNKNIEKLLKKLDIEKIEDLPGKESLENQLNELRKKLQENAEITGSITSQLRSNEENLKRLRQAESAFNAADAVFTKWDRLNKVFGGTRFRTLVQTYILRPLLNNANIYLEKITDRYTLTCSEDNEQLSILVLDRYNKNQVRSVTVLSGGERFMISLALSLALSSLNRQDMNVNILFIDEGFGTLDENNLNSVMETLEKLQEIAGQTNRRVGIISHREELVERIPVKIRVKKKGEGRSLVEITNE